MRYLEFIVRIDYDVFALTNFAFDEINAIANFIKYFSAYAIKSKTTNTSAQQSKLYNWSMVKSTATLRKCGAPLYLATCSTQKTAVLTGSFNKSRYLSEVNFARSS